MPGRGSALMTEYRRSYQPSQFRCAATTYFSNRDFRLQQLQRFQNHSTDPFIWPDDDDDDEFYVDEVTAGCDETAGGRGRRELFEPAHQYRHRQLRRLYESRARSTEAPADDGQAWCNSDQKDCSDSRASCESRNESQCSVSTVDDDDDVHIVRPSQHDHCSSCMESTHTPVCGCRLVVIGSSLGCDL